jgi:SAM-dependent methyltransferase
MNIAKFFCRLMGVSPLKAKRRLHSLLRLPAYFKSYREIKKQLRRGTDVFSINCASPYLLDIDEEGGEATGVYFHQDLYVAQEIFRQQPVKHVDIGSRIDGFVAHVASFREIEVMDIRRVEAQITNMVFVQKDLMQEDTSFFEYCDSLSCLHALEHFGLGRYGDTLDIDGHKKGLKNISRLLQKGGTAYFSVPIGPQRIEFNGMRVFSVRYMLGLLAEEYDLCSFSYIDDRGDLFTDVPLTEALIDSNCGCRYGCGVFVMRKK